MGWQQRSKCLAGKSKSAHLVALPYWYPTFLQQTQLLIELLSNIFHSSGAVYILWMYRILRRPDVLSPHWHGCGSRAMRKCCMRTCFLVLSDGICASPFHFIVPLTLKVPDDDLIRVFLGVVRNSCSWKIWYIMNQGSFIRENHSCWRHGKIGDFDRLLHVFFFF